MYIDTYVMFSGMITILCVAVQGFQMGGDPPYDTSEEKLLDVYLPSHPNSMFFENDSDVLPELRHLPRYWWKDVDGYVCH